MSIQNKVSAPMRSRLLTNRHGKLTTDQWKDIVTEPLITLLLLLAPAIVILGPSLFLLTLRIFFVLLVVAAIIVMIPMVFRARRYARAPIYFERLYAGDHPTGRLFFWRPQVLYTERGEALRFNKRLAPFMRLHPNHAYVAYYLREADQHVLLSLAPADHPEAEKWQPSTTFYDRQARRTRR